MLRPARHPSLALAALALSGCMLDWNSLRADARAPTDTRPEDVTEPMDSGVDTGVVVDSGVATDTGVDSGISNDTGVDSGVAMDTGVDSGVTNDTGVDTGVDVRSDTGVMVPDADPGCTGPVVVNEVQTRGNSNAGDEFVEIVNVGTCTVSLAGWTLRYGAASSTGSTSTFWTGTAAHSLAPGQFGVVRSGAVAAPAASAVDLGLTASALGLADSGGVGVYTPSATRIDSVAWQQMGGTTVSATHPHREGATPATSPPGTSGTIAVARVPNATDTNTNSADFQARTMVTIGLPNM